MKSKLFSPTVDDFEECVSDCIVEGGDADECNENCMDQMRDNGAKPRGQQAGECSCAPEKASVRVAQPRPGSYEQFRQRLVKSGSIRRR